MAYSKLKSIEVQNFMSYEAAKLTFDESGILNIKGYNDSGKSALLRAIMVCLSNINKTVQSKWIREGADYFRVVLNFDDGVSIIRDKYKNGQSLYEMYKDKKKIYSTKQGNKLSKVDDVPQPIQDYIGLCNTDTGCLNYQSCTDKMLLVETTGSENYMMMNEVLKTDEIVAAQKMMRYDRSAVNNNIQEDEASINALNLRKEQYIGYDDTLLESLKEKNEELKGSSERKDSLDKNIEMIEEMKSIVIPPEVSSIDAEKLAGIRDIKDTLNKFNSIIINPEISTLDIDKLAELKYLKDTLGELNSIKVSPQLSNIEVENLKDLQEILGLLQEIKQLPDLVEINPVDEGYNARLSDLNEIDAALTAWVIDLQNLKGLNKCQKAKKKELSSCIAALEKKGVKVEICPNCGEAIIEGSGHVHA